MLEHNRLLTEKILVVMHILLGVGAMFGGLTFIIDPSGRLMKMPVEFLKNSPFNSFLIPGIILFLIVGILPLVVAYALTTKRRWRMADLLNIFPEMYWGWTFSLYIGFVLVIWIALEAFYIGVMAAVHLGYILYGLAIQAVTLLPSVQKNYLMIGTNR
ncbi:MAG TPA: hypothetical protein VLX91_15425 [Candidatus Acidoferrales bacterium]|nr:hypothetical protein [Candidatus Acidoferrales bacterium]